MERHDELLAKVDEVRKRKKVSYEEARKALEKNGYDVLEALIYFESQKDEKYDDFREYKDKAVEEIKKTTSDLVDFTYKGQTFEAPLPVALISVLVLARKPKLLLGAAGALLLAGVDVNIKRGNKEIQITKPVKEKFLGLTNALGFSKVSVSRKMDDFTRKIHFRKEEKQEEEFDGYFSPDLY